MTLYPHLVVRALELAALWHHGQWRKHPAEQIPYVSHPAAVGYLLLRAGEDEETVAAGVLHDVIEDCGVSKEELAAATTPRVADLVAAVSEPKELPYEERKTVYRNVLAAAPREALAIAAADHVHNLHSVLRAAQTSEDVWGMFSADRDVKMAHERKTHELIAERLDGPLVDAYTAALRDVERLP